MPFVAHRLLRRLFAVEREEINVENGRRRGWYVVYSHPHKEEQAQFRLRLKGLECFFPRLRVPGPRENKSRVIALFPNYIFVRFHVGTESHLIVWTPGVKRIVSFGTEPIPLPDDAVHFLQCQADPDGVIQAQSKIACGQQVEICGGPFEGLIGIIEVPPDSKGRVKVLLRLLNRQVSVKFGVELIKGSSTAWAPGAAPNTGLSWSAWDSRVWESGC